MSSFAQNSAASEIQDAPAQNLMQLPYGGTDGGAMYAPPPSTMLPPPPTTNYSQPLPDTADEEPYKQNEGFTSGDAADNQYQPEGFASVAAHVAYEMPYQPEVFTLGDAADEQYHTEGFTSEEQYQPQGFNSGDTYIADEAPYQQEGFPDTTDSQYLTEAFTPGDDTPDEQYQPEGGDTPDDTPDKQYQPEGGDTDVVAMGVVNHTVVNEQNNTDVEMMAMEVVNTQTVLNEQNNNAANNGQVIKRKRGRPRKYPRTEGSIVPVPAPSESGGLAVENVAVQGSSAKRGRGRPRGSRGKPRAAANFPVSEAVTPALSGCAGVGFTPHVVTVTTGEDVLARLMSFSQLNTQAVCVLSANGTISNVTLQQPSSSGGTVTYEGCFEILSLSGSFLLLETSGHRSRTGGLSVSLSGPDGHVLGGAVAGLLTAASPVQIVVGTFVGAGQRGTRLGSGEGFTGAPKLVSGALAEGSPRSLVDLTESSGGPGSPLNYNTGGCNNTNQQTIPDVNGM